MWPYYLTFHNKLMILFMIMVSLMTTLLSDLMIMWFMLEMSNFLFITLLSINLNNKKINFLFFFIQAISSFLMIISISMTFISYQLKMGFFMMLTSLMIKIGIPPVHFWMPMITPYMDWYTICVMFTLQKLIPFIFLSSINTPPNLIIFMILMCMIVPPLFMLNNLNFKKLLTYSSINQTGWMIMMVITSPSIWLTYIIMYTISLLISIKFMLINKLSSIKKTKNIFLTKMSSMIMMMNMSGLPPFSFFLIKWYSTILIIHHSKLYFIIIIMLMSSLFMMFVYMLMMIKIMMINFSESKMKMKSHSESKNNVFLIYLMMTPFMILMF